MEYKSYKKIQERVEVFEDASFVSLQDDKTALIKNSNGDIWSVPFSFENEQLTLFGESAELVELAPEVFTEEEKEETVLDINKVILESSSDSNDQYQFEDNLNRLVEAFINERSKYKKKKKSTMAYESESDDYEDEDDDYDEKKKMKKKSSMMSENINDSESIWKSLDDDSKNFTLSFIESWEDKIKQVKDNFNELFESGFLFSNGTIKRKQILDPVMVLESYKNKKENVKTFFESLEYINDWYLRAEELGVLSESMEGVSPISKEWKTILLKNLVIQKRKGLEVNITEVLNKLEQYASEMIAESDITMNLGLNSTKVPGSHNGENQINFLKMSGIFTSSDMEKLISDFTRAMATYQSAGMDRDTLGKISSYKDITDKMYRTNNIDDETVSKVITNFNTTFGPVKDDMYAPLTTFKAG